LCQSGGSTARKKTLKRENSNQKNLSDEKRGTPRESGARPENRYAKSSLGSRPPINTKPEGTDRRRAKGKLAAPVSTGEKKQERRKRTGVKDAQVEVLSKGKRRFLSLGRLKTNPTPQTQGGASRRIAVGGQGRERSSGHI